jgi:hypothetical protein
LLCSHSCSSLKPIMSSVGPAVGHLQVMPSCSLHLHRVCISADDRRRHLCSSQVCANNTMSSASPVHWDILGAWGRCVARLHLHAKVHVAVKPVTQLYFNLSFTEWCAQHCVCIECGIDPTIPAASVQHTLQSECWLLGSFPSPTTLVGWYHHVSMAGARNRYRLLHRRD